MSFLFSSIFPLPHWLVSISPFFFSLDRLPPLPFSFLIRPLLGPIRPLYATHPLLPLVGSNFPFRSPLFPPISFVSLLSSLF